MACVSGVLQRFGRSLEEELSMGKPDRKKPDSIANGFVKLALAIVVFGISYVLFFSFYYLGN